MGKIFGNNDKEHFAPLCQVCYESPERKAEQEAEHLANIRTQRIERTARLMDEISRIVPPLYRDAHINGLKPVFRETFFKLSPSEGLFLSSPVGVGKTHALYAFARYFILKGVDVIFYRYEDLLCDIRASYTSDSVVDEMKLLNRLKNVRKLFIDDLGTTSGINVETDFSLRTLFNILDHRINYCLPTFLSSNKTIEELGQSFDKRIFSRIAGSCQVLNLSGKDKRLKQ